MSKIVRKSLSDSPMTARRKRRLGKLAKRADSAIDFSDIPELTGKFWENAVRNPFYRPVKKQLTLRLDADVIFGSGNMAGATRPERMLCSGLLCCRT